MDSVSILVSIQPIGTISIFIASLAISTIVSISDSKVVCRKVVEPKAQPCIRLLSENEIEEDIDLDEEIEIPKWDFDNSTIDKMKIASQILYNKEKQNKLREERNREYKIIESAKNILTEVIGVEVDTSQHILFQLEEVV